MMSLRTRITSSFLILIGLSVLTTGIFVAFLLRSSYLDSLDHRLYREASLIAETVNWNERDLPAQAILYGQKLEADLIFLSTDGRVLGSYGEKAVIQSQRHRQEIAQALKGKTVSNMNDEELFTALPVIRNGQILGVIQLDIELDVISQSLQNVWISLGGGLIIAFILAAFASSRIASGVTQPLEEVTRVADDISRKRFHRRVYEDGDDEIAKLGKAINRMAYSLQFQVETIRRSERRLKSVIETMESGLILINTRGRVSLVNKAFERLFGVPSTDIVGLKIEEISYPTGLGEMLQRCSSEKVRFQEKLHLYYPEERVLDAHFAPMWVEADGVGVVVVFHDLTAIRRLEEMRRDFVANVSHEVKTPITSIRGFAETLLDGAHQDPATCREFLQIIHDESIRLQALVSDILDLSQIESKRLPMKFEMSNPSQIILSVLRTLEERLQQKDQQVHVELPSFLATIDPDRYRQIVLNLVSNAMTYTPAGGEVKVKLGKEEKRFFLQISDTGIGIPESDLPRIFERFYRVDKARSRNSGGTGLGLAIVKHLVEEHHGEIDVKSKVGEGTTFTIWFPLEQENEKPFG
ncbi:two-component system histidine kinase PnpS [Risungbinella massiliensis]|uniref:two-component system histidine kinase PnpS n=1 Tax=Risungbinella massiliensis TaxID=1329796 RepID=UPI0005CC570E|nr:ATP-binding protein [Risungbinella massiliensis]